MSMYAATGLGRGRISRFERLRNRPEDEPTTEPVYIAFDVLELDAKDLRPCPCESAAACSSSTSV